MTLKSTFLNDAITGRKQGLIKNSEWYCNRRNWAPRARPQVAVAFRSDLRPKERHFEEKTINNEECMRSMVELKGGTKRRRIASLERSLKLSIEQLSL